jgi:putative transposase
VKKRLEQIIDEIVHEDQWPLIELAIQPDHVHLFVRTLPSPLPSAIPRLIKGRSSRLLRQEFAHLQRLPVLWSPSSFLSTAGHVSSETIARYLQQQSEHEEVPASTPAPDKERPFIPVLERTGLSGPFSVKTVRHCLDGNAVHDVKCHLVFLSLTFNASHQDHS